MIVDFDSIDIFLKHKKILKKTSKNTSGGSYMTTSQKEAIYFDAVKDEYTAKYSVSMSPASTDALLQVGHNVYFIEFKDGFISQKKIYEVWKKVYESLLLFCDITKQHISDTRQYMTYILVYDEEDNPGCKNQDDQTKGGNLEQDEVQDSPSQRRIMMNIAENIPNRNADVFGLRSAFKGLYFREVLTYDKKMFSDSILV